MPSKAKRFSVVLAMFAMAPIAAFAQLGTQWDSFYQDFERTTSPTSKPKGQTQQQAKSPQQQRQRQTTSQSGQETGQPRPATSKPAPAAPASFDIMHKPSSWEIDVRYKMSEGQFMFETDVGSRLNWDEAFSREIEIKVSRDFMVKNYQLVAEVGYSTGSLTTGRTSDDDVFNELHIFSLGRGSANLSSWNIGIGVRNLIKFAGFDFTPSIGWKQKRQDFQMADHVAPAPFFLDYWCEYDEKLAAIGVCRDIYLDDLDFLFGNGMPGSGYIYIVEEFNGQIQRRDPQGAEWDDVAIIPGIVGDWVNLSWHMLIPAEDFCYKTYGGKTACIEQYDKAGYNNLVDVFGGVSSLNDQRGLTTHIYNVTWSGPYIGATLERAISIKESLKLYGEIFKPFFRAEGTWPLRSDWMQYPSFIDEGNSAWGFLAEMEYKYRFNQKSAFTFGLSREWIKASGADTTLFFSNGGVGFYSESIHHARWKNTSVTLGLSFNL